MKEKQWGLVISLVALLVSIASFIYSMQLEKSKATPNIQVFSVDGARDLVEHPGEEPQVVVYSTVVLQNIGNAPAQIVDVRWESIDVNTPMQVKLFAISDTKDPLQEQYREFFESISDSPIAGIHSLFVKPHEKSVLSLAFFIDFPTSDSASAYATAPINVRVTFVFSNGQQVTILPELKYFGSSTGF